MKTTKEKKGITLIALIITIVILLILAGISIQALTNQGIFKNAQQAKENYNNKQLEEKETLNEFEQKLANYILPENTKDEPQDVGTEVALKDEWGTETTKYIKTSDGTEATEITKVATVYAVSVGNGETVPIPKGFYYVGGNLDTGVIISDNEADKYDGKIDKTTYAYTTSLQGNQFVWVPCEASEYKKCNTWNGITQQNGTLANAEWDTTTPKAELSQIEKYGGFYIGRYEAGLANDMSEFTDVQKNTGSNQIYNVYKIPQSKAGLAPWNFIDWTHSKTNAESMYNNNYVSSGLITGTQWDVILNTLKNKTSLSDSDIINGSSWGNYKNTAIEYTGRKATAYYSSKAWYLSVFGSTETSTTTDYTDSHGDLLTTGASSIAEKYHIFDIAGNLWEWTEEDSHYATSNEYRILRGGSLWNTSGDYSACYRAGRNLISSTSAATGFRVVLYIK